MKPIVWQGCYDEGWKGVITPEAFAHPAKFSRGLIKRILDHMLACGYVKRGDTIGNPFGGIGTGGIEAAYRGLRWVGVELEEKFVGLAKANFALHNSKWAVLGLPGPDIIQGDSRQFDVAVQSVVTSPPFSMPETRDRAATQPGNVSSMMKRAYTVDRQSSHAGNIAGLDHDDFSALIASPPYSGISPEKSSSGVNIEKQWETYRASGGGMSLEKFREQQARHSDGYGTSEGQISELKDRGLSAVISSPPYSDISAGAGGLNTKPARNARQQSGRKNGASQDTDQRYGDDPAQIAKLQDKGVEVVITSPPYENTTSGNDACGITLRLLCHVGFTPVERIHAMLVEETTHAALFGGDQVVRKERKSFFRRLAEKKGSPKIDFEEVLICRRPE